MSEWQPIETAPNDGTRFIGLRDGLVWTTYAGLYYEKWPNEQGGPTCKKEWTRDEGDSIVPYTPTHWMPLPEPPVEKIPYSECLSKIAQIVDMDKLSDGEES